MVDQHHRASSTPRPRRLLAMAAIVSTAVVLPFASPAAAVSFSNSAPIEIGTPVMGELYTAANLYPSNISVSGFTGAATDVNVTLCGFSARFPSDVNVLLVAPNGANALIMSDVGGNGGSEGSDPEPAGWDVAVTNINLTLDDAAPSPLPADSALSTGTWRPVDDDTGEFPLAGFPDADTFPGPAPEPSANVALSTFNGVNPNGTWSLYVVDDFPGLADVGETQLPKFSCGWSIDVTAAGGGGSADKPPADFDGNGTTDVSVFRPATGSWFVRNGTSAAWGTSGDIPVPADYDGNGTADIAVFRPPSGTWFVQNGIAAAWGTSGDIPVPGDYDGNGSADIAVFRPSSGTWFVRNGITVAWGTAGDIPVPADYDGNGTTDVAIFRPSNGVWFVRNGTSAAWGTTGDIPVPGDYDGNGSADIAVFRPSSGTWFVRNGAAAAWGTAGDIPVPGDYDGNGTTDMAIYRPASGTWFVRNGLAAAWGTAGDVPLPLPDAIRRFFFPPL